jgi:antitoxin component of MazEF toxin-antitoxin module
VANIINRWGNSLGVRIPLSVATELGFKIGTVVDVTIEDSRAIISPVKKKYTLAELLEGVTPDLLEVLLPESLITNGAVLAFQVKTIDWVERQVKYIESLPDETIEEVISKLQVLLG